MLVDFRLVLRVLCTACLHMTFHARIRWRGAEPGDETYKCDQYNLKDTKKPITNIPSVFPFVALLECRFQTIDICG